MSGYAKLHQSLLDSSLWRLEPDHVRLLWITMLAMADAKGVVDASLPGLADRARITLEQCRSALDRLRSPDPYSRTKAQEGRRIEDVDGGWRLINYAKHRDSRDPEVRRAQNREAKARQRMSLHTNVSHSQPMSANVSQCQPQSAQAEAEAEAEANTAAAAALRPGSPMSVLIARIREARPEFQHLTVANLKSLLEGVPEPARTRAVESFVRKEGNPNVEAPRFPLKLLRGYLQHEDSSKSDSLQRQIEAILQAKDAQNEARIAHKTT